MPEPLLFNNNGSGCQEDISSKLKRNERGREEKTVDIVVNIIIIIIIIIRATSVKYAGQCSYVREYKNCWTMSILFTKHLNAHLKVCIVQHVHVVIF